MRDTKLDKELNSYSCINSVKTLIHHAKYHDDIKVFFAIFSAEEKKHRLVSITEINKELHQNDINVTESLKRLGSRYVSHSHVITSEHEDFERYGTQYSLKDLNPKEINFLNLKKQQFLNK